MPDYFDPLYSTNTIYIGDDDTRCLTDEIDTLEADITALETGKADTNHTHTGYATADHVHANYATSTHTHSYNDLSDKPTIPTTLPANGGNADTVDNKHASDFADAAHTHAVADVTGLSDQLSAKYAKPSTGIPKTDLASDIQTSLGKADTAVQSLDGYATESYVNTQVSNLVDSSPETLNTLNELAAALGDDPNFATTVATQIGGKVDKVDGKDLSTNDYTTAEKDKLAGIASGAEVNQNAFSNIIVGSTTIAADSKTDTFTLVAGSNVTLTPDEANDTITISATNTTYSTATTSANGLMSSVDKTKLDGIATGANKYTLPTASSSTLGGVKTTSTVTSNSGYTACPIISGVPYYKDTNTTYSSLKNPYALTMQFNGTTNKTYDGSSAQTFNVTPSAIGVADYVIAQGASGAWTYRKWKNGVYECWRQVTGTITYSSTWNNFKIFNGSADWPTGAFVANPTVFYNCYIGSGYAIAARGGLSTTTQFKWAALGTDGDSNVGYCVHVYAIGRWK
jgi:hypothetical protein